MKAGRTWLWPAVWALATVMLGVFAETQQHQEQPERPVMLIADLLAGLVFVVAGLLARGLCRATAAGGC